MAPKGAIVFKKLPFSQDFFTLKDLYLNRHYLYLQVK